MRLAEAQQLTETRIARPAAVPSTPPRRKFDLAAWPGAILFAAATVWILAGNPLKTLGSAAFHLQAIDRNGRVEMRWDPELDQVQKADAAMLDAVDQGKVSRYPIESKILKGGALAYVRHSGDVVLTVTLYKDNQPGERASILSIGPVKPAN